MSIHGTYDPENIFAKILRGEIPSARVYEDDQTLSFMDAFPQSRGHVLVIPKAPSRNILDTSQSELSNIMAKTQMIAKAVHTALKPDGIVITQFNGAPAGQTVFHLHFHIIPRYNSVEMSAHATGQMADLETLEALAQQIKNEL